MAKKKPRTPTPPRGPQAPRRRTGPSRTSGSPDDLGQQHRRLLYLAAAGGFAGLIIVILLIVFVGGGSSGRNEKQLAADFSAAGCTYKTVDAYVPKGQSTHVTSLTKKFPWNTDPPSNGQHYPLWAVWGWYTEAVNPRQVVHNEEHGGVVEWWGPKVPASTVAQLHAFYLEHPDGGFGTPYRTLGSKIALTAWTGDTSRYQQNGYYGQGHIAVCPSYTAKTKTAFEAFRNAYIGKGPEGIPLSADEPGMGPTS